MSMSVEHYYPTVASRRSEVLRSYEGLSHESPLQQNLLPRFVTFESQFPDILPRYAGSFEGSFLNASPEDQRVYIGAIFAGLIVEDISKDFIAQQLSKIRERRSSQRDNLFLSQKVAKDTKNILDKIGIETVYTHAYMGTSQYDLRIAERAFLTADNGRILLDPALMFTEPCAISPAGLMRNMDGRTFRDTQLEAGAVYVGLNMRAKYYSKVKPYPEAWYRH